MRLSQLFGVAILALGACSSGDGGEISTFYRQNPRGAVAGPRKGAIMYLLCAPGALEETAQNYTTNGYRVLGQSDFQNLTPEPLREKALAYARQFGATLVLYSVEPLGQEVHPVTKTVLESESHNVTITTLQQTSTPSPYSVNTDVTSPDFLKPIDNSTSGDNSRPEPSQTRPTYLQSIAPRSCPISAAALRRWVRDLRPPWARAARCCPIRRHHL